MAIKPTKFLKKLNYKKRWMNTRLKIKPSEKYTATGNTAAIAVIHQRGSVIMARLTDEDEVLLYADNKWAGAARWRNATIQDCKAVFDSDRETGIILQLLTNSMRQEIQSLAKIERMTKEAAG
jgi:hypothetical protein